MASFQASAIRVMNFFLEGDIFVNLYTFLILYAKIVLGWCKRLGERRCATIW